MHILSPGRRPAVGISKRRLGGGCFTALAECYYRLCGANTRAFWSGLCPSLYLTPLFVLGQVWLRPWQGRECSDYLRVATESSSATKAVQVSHNITVITGGPETGQRKSWPFFMGQHVPSSPQHVSVNAASALSTDIPIIPSHDVTSTRPSQLGPGLSEQRPLARQLNMHGKNLGGADMSLRVPALGLASFETALFGEGTSSKGNLGFGPPEQSRARRERERERDTEREADAATILWLLKPM